MRRLVAGGAIVAAALVSIGAPAPVAASPLYPPQPPNVTLNISITIIVIGGTVNLTFIGCQIGENVRIDLGRNSSFTSCSGPGGGTSRLSPAGTGSARASITAPMEPGEYVITATGLTSGYTASQRLTVLPAAEGLVTLTPGAAPAAAPPAAAPAAAPGGASSGAAASQGDLPVTGSDNAQVAWIAGSTVVAGLGLAGVAKRRQHRSAG